MEQININVSGIILAAGKSSRMGRDKLSLPFRGLPVLQHVVNAARNSCLKNLTVVIPEGSDLAERIDFTGCNVVTTRQDLGQSESLKVGLRHAMADSDGCMPLLGDLPLLTTENIDSLAGAFAQQSDSWVAPVQEGMRGNPVIIPSAWYPKVFELEGDTGARTILASPGLSLRLLRVHGVGPYMDVDTEQQYQRLLEKYDTKAA